MTTHFPPIARWLGALGIVPQAACLAAVVWGDARYMFAAQALGFAYATLIFSFLGGLWWGLATAAGRAPAWVWFASITPSLLALLAFVPWVLAGDWPGPSLIFLGAAIVAALLVDARLMRIGIAPRWWWRLRAPLSIGLGGLTIVLGLMS